MHVLVAMVDPGMLQGAGTLLLGLASVAGFIFTVVNRTKIFEFLRDRIYLVEAMNDFRRRSEAAESLAASFERANKAMAENLESLDRRVKRLEAIESKFGILVAWVAKIVEYVVFLEREALGAGADLSARAMPPLPPELKDDLTLPEGLRNA